MQKFTIKERTLLHLLECGLPKEDMHGEIDASYSQEGISLAIGAARSLVSRAVEELEEQKFILATSARVIGKRAKVKVYYLTSEGIKKAKELKSDADNLTLTVKDFNSKLKEVKVSDLKKELPELSIVKILKLASEKEYLAFEDLNALAKAAQFVDFSSQAPKLRYFFGRDKELALLRSWVEDSETKIIAIRGIAGIGKSALCSRFINIVKGERNVFWYTVQEWTTQTDILQLLSRFMYAMNKPALNNYLSPTKEPQLEEISKLLQAELHGTNTILVFDDIDKAQSEVAVFFKSLFARLKNTQKVKFLIVGRWLKELYTVREVAIERAVKELTLEGLNERGAFELLKARGFVKELKKLYESTAGHPLCLELIDYKGVKRNVARYIREEIFSKLSEQERKALSLSSVLKAPFSSEVLFKSGIEPTTVETLTEKSLLHVYENDTYSTHDLIKNFFCSRLTAQELALHHKTAAHYYDEIEDYLEAAFHYLQAGDRAQSLELLASRAEKILEQGNEEELRKLAEKIALEDLSFEERAKLARIEKVLMQT
ncbi:MAG: AAA family ATPase [Candidatus Thermoplasmatota archaeon]|nr:AAA family ATPase [Candidatus Thermoplasmatota archaeon]